MCRSWHDIVRSVARAFLVHFPLSTQSLNFADHTTSTPAIPTDRTSTTMDITQESPLLALCAELRNTIWRFTLVDSEAVSVTNNTTPMEPGLLAVCRQIRNECRTIYYAENTFKVRDFGLLHRRSPETRWLASIGVEQAGKITAFLYETIRLASRRNHFITGSYEGDLDFYRRRSPEEQGMGSVARTFAEHVRRSGLRLEALHLQLPSGQSGASLLDAKWAVFNEEVEAMKAAAEARMLFEHENRDVDELNE